MMTADGLIGLYKREAEAYSKELSLLFETARVLKREGDPLLSKVSARLARLPSYSIDILQYRVFKSEGGDIVNYSSTHALSA